MEVAVRDHLVGIGPLVIGIFVVAILIGGVYISWRVREKEPPPPKDPGLRSGAWETREELGHETPPDHGPGHQDLPEGPHEIQEIREPDEVPHNGKRRLPYELHGDSTGPGVEGSRHSDKTEPPKWDPGHSGSHGTG